MARQMDCKQVQKLIPFFLKRDMKGSDIFKFTSHIEKCPVCKEELTIQYLASEGISHLESGTSFHLDQELAAFIERAKRMRRRRLTVRLGLAIYEAVAILIIAAICIYAGV